MKALKTRIIYALKVVCIVFIVLIEFVFGCTLACMSPTMFAEGMKKEMGIKV